MAQNTQITAADWIAIREKVAEEIKEKSQARADTRLNIAEQLMAKGYVDIDFVLAEVRKDFTPQTPPRTAERPAIRPGKD